MRSRSNGYERKKIKKGTRAGRDSNRLVQKHVLFHAQVPSVKLAQTDSILHLPKIPLPKELVSLLPFSARGEGAAGAVGTVYAVVEV